MDDQAYYVPVGNGTEVGLIKFLQDAEIPVHDLIKKKLGRVEAVIPFSTIRKRSIIAIRHPEHEELVRIYIKGAPELIVSKCTRTFDVDGKVIPMQDSQTNYILNDILVQRFTTVGYRTLALAYKDLTLDEFEDLKAQYNNFATEEDRNVLEKSMTFIGLFALHDPLREKVLRSVQYAAKGNITTRLVSGDHIETAKAVAIQAGIITEEQAKNNHNCCMTGEEFRQLVGGIRKEMQEDGSVKLVLEKKDDFRKVIAKNLRVMARATPYDKYLLVVGL